MRYWQRGYEDQKSININGFNYTIEKKSNKILYIGLGLHITSNQRKTISKINNLIINRIDLVDKDMITTLIKCYYFLIIENEIKDQRQIKKEIQKI
jgi:hypothetical protein